MDRINHVELFGGNTMRHKIIIDTCKLSENKFETMVLDQKFEELNCKIANSETEAKEQFDNLFYEYAGDLQKSLYGAELKQGGKYTLVYLSEFGFPVAQKITFESMEMTTYAQYEDAVKMVFTPYRKRRKYYKHLYDMSIMIFEGWQDLKDEDTNDILSDNEDRKVMKSKYACFDGNYINDLEKILKNPVVIYKKYQIGVNGRIYA